MQPSDVISLLKLAKSTTEALQGAEALLAHTPVYPKSHSAFAIQFSMRRLQVALVWPTAQATAAQATCQRLPPPDLLSHSPGQTRSRLRSERGWMQLQVNPPRPPTAPSPSCVATNLLPRRQAMRSAARCRSLASAIAQALQRISSASHAVAAARPSRCNCFTYIYRPLKALSLQWRCSARRGEQR
jgi:hypothetical protein